MKWCSVKASHLLKALINAGWFIKRQKGSHRILAKSSYPDFTFAFHEREEIGPKMLARISKHTGLLPEDL
jgi:predicted RNA binding protein YcfA (HicA-like mRNA interferase family)